MSIIVLCPHGHPVAIDDPRRDHACPRCGSIVTGAPTLAEPARPGALAARPAPRRGRDDDEDDEDEDEDERPRKRKDERLQSGPPRKRPATARAEPEEDEEEDEEDDGGGPVRKLTRKQKQLSMVRLGLMFHIVKFWVYLASMAFGFITLPLVLFLHAFGNSLAATILLGITFNLSATLAPLIGTAGSVMCAMAPPRSQARGTIIVSVIFDVLAPFFGLFQLIMFFAYAGTGDERVGKLQNYMLYARMGCTLVSWWLVQIYLRKLSFFMRESLLASESLNVIVHLLMATVITPTLLVGTIVVAFFMPGILVLILFFATLAWMLFFTVTFPYRQLRLLSEVRRRIWEKYLKPEDDD